MTWVDTSKLKRTVMAYNDEVSFFPSIVGGRFEAQSIRLA